MDSGKDNSFNELDKLFRLMSIELKIDYELLQPYLDTYYDKIKINSVKTKSNNFCRARKQDGLRCTRRCKENFNFCGKHIKNQKYGCIQEIKDNHIELDKFIDKQNNYFVDIENIVYSYLGDDKYKIIGKKRKNGEIYMLNLNSNIILNNENVVDQLIKV